MSKSVDAWEDEWSTAADTPSNSQEGTENKKSSGKVSKAQRRAQQAEFNRQLWAEAEGPQETNFFLESRNAVPLRSEFKPPPILLSRKGPIIQSPRPPTDGLNNLTIQSREAESSSEDEATKARKHQQSLAERQAQAARDREEKQRKYEERRLELFGPSTAIPNNTTTNLSTTANRSGNSSPNTLTPPGSRSATPSRGRGGNRGARRGGGGNNNTSSSSLNNSHQPRPQPRDREREKDLFDPSYAPRRDQSAGVRPKPDGSPSMQPLQQPIRAPRGPDSSGRAGFGFASNRGGKQPQPQSESQSQQQQAHHQHMPISLQPASIMPLPNLPTDSST